MILCQGFLLSYVKYGDQDAVIHVFTKEKGYQTFFSRGIYSHKNRKKPYLTPFNEVQLSVSTPKGRKLPVLNKLEPVSGLSFYEDIKANSILFFLSELLDRILKNEEANPSIYNDISFFLKELNRGNYVSHHVFLLKILKNFGVLPLLSSGEFLDQEKGIFGAEQSHSDFDSEISTLFKEMITVENPYEIVVPAVIRRKFLDSIIVYFHYHIPDFRTPKTLEIVQQIFD